MREESRTVFLNQLFDQVICSFLRVFFGVCLACSVLYLGDVWCVSSGVCWFRTFACLVAAEVAAAALPSLVPEPSSSQSEPTANPTKKAMSLRPMVDVKSAAYQLGQLGFKVGAVVRLKKQPEPPCPCSLWTVTDVGVATATLTPTGVHASSVDEKVLMLANLKEYWSVSTNKPQELVPERMASKMVPEMNTNWKSEYVRAQIVLVLTCMSDQCNSLGMFSGLEVFQNPFAVRAKKDFKPLELKLAPATQLVKARTPEQKAPDKAVDLGELGGIGVCFHLVPQFVINKPDGQNFLNPFWCVPTAPEGEDGRSMTHVCLQARCLRL